VAQVAADVVPAVVALVVAVEAVVPVEAVAARVVVADEEAAEVVAAAVAEIATVAIGVAVAADAGNSRCNRPDFLKISLTGSLLDSPFFVICLRNIIK